MANTIDKSLVNSFIPELWANEALTLLPSYLNLARTVNRNYDNKPAKVGDTITIPKTGALTANDKAANTAVTLNNPADSEVSISLDTHKEVSFSVEDVAKAQANQSVIQRYMGDAVITLAESIEEDLAGLYSSAGSTVSAGSSVADADMLSARKELVDNKLPKVAPRFGYFDSAGVNDLLALGKFTAVRDYAQSGSPVETGELGTIYGIKIFESQMVETSGSPSTYHALVYGPDAMVLAMRPLPMEGNGMGARQTVVADPNSGLAIRVTMSYDASYLATQVTVDALYGVSVLRSEHLIDIQHT